MITAWQTVKKNIQKQISDHRFYLWVDPLQVAAGDGNVLKLICPNAFTAKRLADDYQALFAKEFGNLGFSRIKILFVVDKNVSGGTSRAADLPGTPSGSPKINRINQLQLPGLDIRVKTGRWFKTGFSFDDFVVGDNSDFAFSASRSLARGHFTGHGILYLFADTGLGKSHLSKAVGQYIHSNGPAKRVWYITAEDFTNDMINAIKNKTIDRFKAKYRQQCDFLILEDVQFLSGKPATQLELVRTFDHLLDAEKKIIFSSNILPDDIPRLDTGLRSRLSMGLVTQIKAPGFDTRVRILLKKAKVAGYEMPREVLEYIAQELCRDVRQLESGLHGIAAKGQLLNRSIDLALARGVIKTISTGPGAVTLDKIIQLISKEFSVSEKDLAGPSRKRRIVKSRQLAIFLARKYTDQSIKHIAQAFGRYHATAIYSVNAVERELRQKGKLFDQVNYLSKKIESNTRRH